MCAMDVLLLPFRWIYRGLVWFANSPRTLIFSYLTMIVVAGVLYSRVEHKSAADSVWWAVVTASTVGYGDISPTTFAGRCLAALLISTMVLLVIPLITAHFASRLIVDDDAFEHAEQEELKADVRRLRALVEEMAARQGIEVPEPDRPAPAGRPGSAALLWERPSRRRRRR
jgi:voltage-gated potassium channel